MNNITEYRTVSSHDARELTLQLQEAMKEGWHLFGLPNTERTYEPITGITTVKLTQALVKYDDVTSKSLSR
jgi:hypothetical protein